MFPQRPRNLLAVGVRGSEADDLLVDPTSMNRGRNDVVSILRVGDRARTTAHSSRRHAPRSRPLAPLRLRPRGPLGALGELSLALDPRGVDVAVHCQRDLYAAPAQHLRRAVVERASRRCRPAPRHAPLPLRSFHRQGGGRRVRARRRARLHARRLPRALPHPLARFPALGRRVADRADPRRRADGRRLAEPEVADALPGLGRRRRDRRVPDVLPGDDQHDSRLALGGSARARADALVRGRQLAHSLETPLPRRAAVHLRGAQGVRDGECRRRDHRRAPVVDPGRARRPDHQLQPVLHDPADRPVGHERDCGRARHLVLPRHPAGGEARRATRAGELCMSVVEIKDVTKRFDETTALQGIDLEIEPAEFVSLIGPSGCGKSTLLRIIGDLVEPTSGTAAVNGKPARQARIDRDYGIVFQDAVLYDWRTVAKNIALPLELARWDRGRRTAKVKEMVDLVELTGFENHYPWQLSGGMQQRVSIARALSFDPALLLMDEPFGALDEMTRERLNMELLQIWQASGSTVVFVTHSIAEAVFLSTRVVVMSPRPGRISNVIPIDLPQPRTATTREEPRFFELVTEVREALHLGHDLEHAPA